MLRWPPLLVLFVVERVARGLYGLVQRHVMFPCSTLLMSGKIQNHSRSMHGMCTEPSGHQQPRKIRYHKMFRAGGMGPGSFASAWFVEARYLRVKGKHGVHVG